MKYSELARKLRRPRNLVVARTQDEGNHPRHPSREIAAGTLSTILKHLGLTMEDLERGR